MQSIKGFQMWPKQKYAQFTEIDKLAFEPLEYN